MAANVSQPLTEDARSQTCRAGAAVTGQRFVKISASGTAGLPTVIHATQNDAPFGVSAYTVASGEILSVLRRGSGIVQVLAGAALSAGDLVQPDANGKAIVYVPPTIDVTLGAAQNVPTKKPSGRVVFDAADATPAYIDLDI